MPNEFIVKNGLVVGGNVVTSGTITINGALAATQSWVTSQAYLTSASLSGYATQSYVTSAISSLIDAAPAALDTLNELAAALGDDANFSTTITNSIAGKMALYNGVGAPDFNTNTTNGIYRNQGGANAPVSGSHFTMFSAFQPDGNYGWQLAASASDSLYFRFKDANFNSWVQLATRSWVTSQNYLTSYTDTLATVTSRGASTSTPVTFNGNVTLGNNADLVFQDLSGTFPTTGKGFDWTLNNDGARIYAVQPGSDSIDLVFQLRDNATTNDRFVFWVDEWQGPAYDKYPLIISGGTEFDLKDSSLYTNSVLRLSNSGVLQNVTGNISMFTNNAGYLTSESDTLATVTGRGATTSTNISVNTINIGTDATYGAAYRSVSFGYNGDGSNRILAANNTSDGMYFMAATGQGFNFRPNGGTANLVVINSTGNVGIGTTSPATPLHVTGGASGSGGWNRTATLAATYPGLIFNSNGTKWGGMAYDYSAAMRFWVNANNDDIFAGTLAMSILNNGNVGIGTTSPSEKLHIGGGNLLLDNNQSIRFRDVSGVIRSVLTYSSGNVVFLGSDVSHVTAIKSEGVTVFSTDGSKLLIDPVAVNQPIVFGTVRAGNVGIGTTNPLGKLHIADDGPNALRIGDTQVSTIGETNDGGYPGMKIVPYNSNIHIGISSTNDNKINLWHGGSNYTYWQQLSTYSVISNYSTNALVFQVNGGSVGIGTTTPSYKLHVVGSFGALTSGVTLEYNSGILYHGGSYYQFPSGSYYNIYGRSGMGLIFGSNNTEVGRFDLNGNLGIGTTAPNQKLQVAGFVNAQGYVNNGVTFRKSFYLGNIAAGATTALGLLTFGSVFTHHFRVTITSYYGTKTVEFIGYQGTMGKATYGFAGGGGEVVIEAVYVSTNINAVKIGVTSAVQDYVYTATVECMSLFGSWVDYAAAEPITPTTLGSSTTLLGLGNSFVGVNTNNPLYNLHVVSSSATIGAFRNSGAAIGQLLVGNTAGDLQLRVLATGDGLIMSDTSKYLALGSNGTERLRITSAGDVGIGTTAPAYKLEVNGTMRVSGDTSVVGNLINTNSNFRAFGSTSYGASTWGISIGNGSSSNNYYKADNHYFQLGNGTDALNINSLGNVGIGTASPSNKLVAVSDAVFNSENTYAIAAAAASDPAYKTVIGYSYANDIGLIAAVRTGIGWRNLSIPQGSLGIGTLSPSTLLHVNGVITATGGNSTNWNTAYGWGNHASASYATTSYVTTQINNLINGAPGVLDTLDELAAALGDDANFATTVTNSIAGKVSKAGDTMTGNLTLSGGTNILFTGGSHSISGNSTGYLHFHGYTNVYFNEQLVIRGGIQNDGGNVLIDDNLNVNGELAFLSGGGGYTNIIRSAAYPSEGYPPGSNYWIEYRAQGGHHFILNTDGGVGSGANAMDDFVVWQGAIDGNRLLEVSNIGNLWIAGSLTESSSLKLKENVETSEGNLEKVVNLRPVTYNKIGSQTKELGLIAEEVAEVYPEFVQYDENGEPIGVHYSRLTAALIGAVKELNEQLQELKRNK